MIKVLLMRCGVIFATCLATCAAGQAGESSYALKIRGLTVGTVELNVGASASGYAVEGVIRSAGVVNAFRKFSYHGLAEGNITKDRLIPIQYQEVADTGRRSSTVVMTYKHGLPTLVEYTSPKEAGADAPDPATQGGTLDPLSAVFNLLRDVPRKKACDLDMAIFDGKRRTRIALWPDGTANGLPVCSGIYQRLQGFTAKEVARHTEFNLTLTYEDAGNDQLRVARVAFDSLYGVASVDRQ